MTIREICEYYGQQYDNVKHMDNYLYSLRERYYTEMGIVNVGHMTPKEKLNHVRDLLKELKNIGADYGVFQSAQITHKNLKKAYKLLEGLS